MAPQHYFPMNCRSGALSLHVVVQRKEIAQRPGRVLLLPKQECRSQPITMVLDVGSPMRRFPAFRPSLCSLFSLFAPRVFHNSFAVKRFRTRVSPSLLHTTSPPRPGWGHQSPVTNNVPFVSTPFRTLLRFSEQREASPFLKSAISGLLAPRASRPSRCSRCVRPRHRVAAGSAPAAVPIQRGKEALAAGCVQSRRA
jgi:hypothetical protein